MTVAAFACSEVGDRYGAGVDLFPRSMDMVGDRMKRSPPGRQPRQRPGHGPLCRNRGFAWLATFWTRRRASSMTCLSRRTPRSTPTSPAPLRPVPHARPVGSNVMKIVVLIEDGLGHRHLVASRSRTSSAGSCRPGLERPCCSGAQCRRTIIASRPSRPWP